MEVNAKLGSCFEDLSEQELINLNGGLSPTLTTTSSTWCFAASAAVSGGISAAATFIVSATYNRG
ncbi:hypothetical protein CAC02_07945 [Streptococcus gallolyticus]|uniref:Uncharacterized protein n=1 Tax=Streptococcus gallolyticus TaxID=315405 RepID=A0A368UD36_9STRE|nr:hypothetical protein [Streptococcus gallolyticus]RCW16538.1 hypothetical protein CAC02_07945 [Streptococcus gallolyticus]